MAETDPIRVYPRDGQWLVDYGSYAHGFHTTREQAATTATTAVEQRNLIIEDVDPDNRQASLARNEIADRRDAIADERDRVADRRDQLADERDRAAGKQWPTRLSGLPELALPINPVGRREAKSRKTTHPHHPSSRLTDLRELATAGHETGFLACTNLSAHAAQIGVCSERP